MLHDHVVRGVDEHGAEHDEETQLDELDKPEDQRRLRADVVDL